MSLPSETGWSAPGMFRAEDTLTPLTAFILALPVTLHVSTSFGTSLDNFQGLTVSRFTELVDVYPFWQKDLLRVELTPLRELCIICCHSFPRISIAWNLNPESDCTSDNILLSYQHISFGFYHRDIDSNAIKYCLYVSLRSWRLAVQKSEKSNLLFPYSQEHNGAVLYQVARVAINASQNMRGYRCP